MVTGMPAKLKLIDFGYAASFANKRLTGRVGTCEYMAPEVIRNEQPYTEKCDIWSIGVSLFVICFAMFPWDTDSGSFDERIVAIMENRQKDLSKLWRAKDLPDGMRDLIDRLMTRDPSARPKAKHVIKRTAW